MSEDALINLAKAAGLLVDWRDAAGQAQRVTPDSLRAVLTAMGFPAETPREIEESRKRLNLLSNRAPGLVVIDAGDTIPLPPSTARTARIVFEDGDTQDLPFKDGRLIAPDRPGYYRLELGDLVLPLAIAPRKGFTVADAAPGRRLWGTAVQLYGLRENSRDAFGDFAALAAFAAEAGRRGIDALAISPVHALFLANPEHYSPYAPSTRLFLNGFFAGGNETDRAEAAEAAGDLIDWSKALPDKRAALRRAYERFREEAGEHTAFEAFRRAGGADLERHAIFEALHARFLDGHDARGWPEWPAAYQDIESQAVLAFAKAEADEVRFHLFVQWLADQGFAAAQAAARGAGMAVGLIADLAVGMDAGGSHAWSRRADLLNGLSVGAPPDLFQPKGQDWGLAAFSPFSLSANGYAPFIATLRAAMKHAGGVRIDHAMGLQRLWLTPHGGEAKHGAYLTYPFEDMLRLIKLESWRARAIVLAEDLGTVPDGFRESLDGAGAMGMRVLWFERDGLDFLPPGDWSAGAVAMTSTHDLPTVAGWWTGADLDWRTKLADTPNPEQRVKDEAERQEERGRLWAACGEAGLAEGKAPPDDAPAPAVDAAVGFVGAAACDLALVQIEDLIGTADQANLPGVTEGHPNWRRRLPAAADVLFERPEVRARIERLNQIRSR
jgi:4-alpha-glucanotransferase